MGEGEEGAQLQGRVEIQLLAIHLGSVCLRSARKVLGRNRYLTRNRFICGEIDSQAGLAIVQMVHLNPAHWGRGGAIRVGRLHIVVHIVRMEQHIRWDKRHTTYYKWRKLVVSTEVSFSIRDVR